MFSKLAFLLPSLLALPISAATSLPYSAELRYAPVSSPHESHHLATISYDPSKFASDISSWTPPKVPEGSLGSETSLPLVKILTKSGGSTLTSIGVFNETLLADDGRGVVVKLALDPEGNVYNAFVTAGVETSSDTPKIAPVTKSGKAKSKARLEREAREAAREAKLAEKAKSRSAKKSGTTSTSSAAPTTATSVSSPNSKIQIQLIQSIPGPAPKLAAPRVPKVAADGTPAAVGAQDDDEEEVPEKSFFQKYWWIILLVSVFALGGGGSDK